MGWCFGGADVETGRGADGADGAAPDVGAGGGSSLELDAAEDVEAAYAAFCAFSRFSIATVVGRRERRTEGWDFESGVSDVVNRYPHTSLSNKGSRYWRLHISV